MKLKGPLAFEGRRPVSFDDQVLVRDTLAVHGKWRIDFDRYSDDEAREVVALVKKLTGGGGPVDRAALSAAETRRLEALIETGHGLEPGEIDAKRTEAIAFARLKKLGARERALARLGRKQEASLLTEIHKQVQNRCLWGSHVGVLIALLSAFETGEVLGPSQRFEGSGEDLTYVFDRRMGVLGGHLNGDGAISNALGLLEHLEKNAWVVLSSKGPEVRVRLGKRALKIVRRRDP
jgi:hypothetical protein